MNVADWLWRAARLRPEAPALLTGDRLEATQATFAARAGGLAATLGARFGVAPGDRVGLFMKNRAEYLEALYGIWWAGAVAVPVNAKLHAREAAWILDDAGAGLCLVSDDGAGPLADAAPDTRLVSVDDPDWRALTGAEPLARPAPRDDQDLAWLFYTSGTTGRPKGVMLSNLNLMAMTLCYPLDVDPVTAVDAALYAAPLSHGAGMYSLVHARAGARHVVPPSGAFDPAEILDLAPRLSHVSMFAAPTMVRRLVDAAKTGAGTGEGLRTIVYGGGPMYVADIEEAVATLGSRFVQIYGQGESPMTITALSRALVADRDHPRWRERLGSVGTAQSCVDLRIADAEGHPLPEGEVGEILVRGPQVMRGYWANPEATAKTLRGGWLWTGDLGRLDADGFLTLTDRSRDVIISGGTNIYPREVEEVLLTHPDVHEVAVVGQADLEWGEVVVAFVVLQPGTAWDPGALDRHCTETMARFKRPKVWRRIDALPKNNYGKVMKGDLRALSRTAPCP